LGQALILLKKIQKNRGKTRADSLANMPYKIPYKNIAIIMKDMICSDCDKKSF
jgi:hypothetical protein